MNNEEKIKQAAEILSKAKNIVGFTGAGTSAESGVIDNEGFEDYMHEM